jgi:hypothetical protein
MLPMSPEEKALLNYHLTESARILREYTELEKQKDFESIEVEVRKQMLEIVGPTIGEFFFQKEEKKGLETSEKSKP